LYEGSSARSVAAAAADGAAAVSAAARSCASIMRERLASTC